MKTLMMIRRMKEVLTWVWIAVIGTAICLNVCAQTHARLERTGETTEFLYGQRFGT